MIFGRMESMGKEFVLIGLAKENFEQITKGAPLMVGPVPGDPFLKNMVIIVMAGETNKDMLATLQKLELADPNLNPNELL